MTFTTKTTPYPFQLAALEAGCFREYFAYFMDMGTGKSKVALDNAATLFDHKKINFLLLTCPKSIIRGWLEDQIPTHLGVPYITIKYIPKNGRSKIYKEELAEFKHSKNKLKIVACNFGAFLNETNINEFYNMLRIYNSMWVIDESSKIKNIDAATTKTIVHFSKTANYRRILTGTPMTVDLRDLWSQYMFLHPDIIGCDTMTKFKNRYTIQSPIPTAWLKGRFKGKNVVIMRVTGYKNENELIKLVSPHTFRVKLEPGLIPEPVFIKKEVELTSEQKRLYEDVKRKVRIDLMNYSNEEIAIDSNKGITIDINSSIAKISKLQQILCGFIYDENHNVIKIKSNRTKLCCDLVEESSSPVIIFYWFRQDKEFLIEELKKREISFTDNSSDFQQNKELYRVFLGQMASASMGSNLQHAKITIYYSNCVFAEYRWQSERRNYRLGQDSTVVYIDLIAPGTIDETILENIADKTIRARLIDQLENQSLFTDNQNINKSVIKNIIDWILK